MKNRDKCHERSVRRVYDDSRNLHFWELLVKGNSVSIHQKNLQDFVIEIFKAKQGISPEIISDLLQFVKKPYNFRNNNMLQRKKDKVVYFGTERISSLAPEIGNFFLGNSKMKFAWIVLNKK